MYRILLVDDEILVRDAIKENIDWKSMDCQLVGDCENGKQAADFVKSHPVDIVLTDILMPYMDGMELSHFLNQSKYNGKGNEQKGNASGCAVDSCGGG